MFSTFWMCFDRSNFFQFFHIKCVVIRQIFKLTNLVYSDFFQKNLPPLDNFHVIIRFFSSCTNIIAVLTENVLIEFDSVFLFFSRVMIHTQFDDDFQCIDKIWEMNIFFQCFDFLRHFVRVVIIYSWGCVCIMNFIYCIWIGLLLYFMGFSSPSLSLLLFSSLFQSCSVSYYLVLPFPSHFYSPSHSWPKIFLVPAAFWFSSNKCI